MRIPEIFKEFKELYINSLVHCARNISPSSEYYKHHSQSVCSAEGQMGRAKRDEYPAGKGRSHPVAVTNYSYRIK